MENLPADPAHTLAYGEPARASRPYTALWRTYWGVQLIQLHVENLLGCPAHIQTCGEPTGGPSSYNCLLRTYWGVQTIYRLVYPNHTQASLEPSSGLYPYTGFHPHIACGKRAGGSSLNTGLCRSCWGGGGQPIHRRSTTHSLWRTCWGVKPVYRLPPTYSLWKTCWVVQPHRLVENMLGCFVHTQASNLT